MGYEGAEPAAGVVVFDRNDAAGLGGAGDGEDYSTLNTLMTEDSLKFSEPSMDSLAMWREGAARAGADDQTPRRPLHKAGVSVSWELGSAGAFLLCTICTVVVKSKIDYT